MVVWCVGVDGEGVNGVLECWFDVDWYDCGEFGWVVVCGGWVLCGGWGCGWVLEDCGGGVYFFCGVVGYVGYDGEWEFECVVE